MPNETPTGDIVRCLNCEWVGEVPRSDDADTCPRCHAVGTCADHYIAAPAHTPGPWRVVQHLQPLGDLHIYGDGVHCALVDMNDAGEANARLIAAAPELLALVERLAALLGQHIDTDAEPVEMCAFAEAEVGARALLGRLGGA